MSVIWRWWTCWLWRLRLWLSLRWNRLGLLLLLIRGSLLLLGQLLLHHHLLLVVLKHAVLVLPNDSLSCRSSYGLCWRYHNILIHHLVPFGNLLIPKLDVIDPKVGRTFSLESFFQKLLILPHKLLNLQFVQDRVREPAIIPFVTLTSRVDPFARELLGLVGVLAVLLALLTIVVRHEVFAQVVFQVVGTFGHIFVVFLLKRHIMVFQLLLPLLFLLALFRRWDFRAYFVFGLHLAVGRGRLRRL